MIIIILLVAFFFSGCGANDLVLVPSLAEKLPKVVGVDPLGGSENDSVESIEVTLSKQVDGRTVNGATFLVVENYQDMPKAKVIDMITDGELSGMKGENTILDNGIKLNFKPTTGFKSGRKYGVILTNEITSEDGFAMSVPFISTFTMKSVESGAAAAVSAADTSDNSEEDSGQQSSTDSGTNVNRPEFLVINELLYDVVGDDTDGNVFIELYGTPLADISGYKIYFANGDDGKIYSSIKIPNGAKLNSTGLYLIADDTKSDKTVSRVIGADMITTFDPQNGPDSALLLSPESNLMDAVCYGNPTVKISEGGFSVCEGNFAPDAPSGKSISRINGEDYNDNASDFVTSEPTPGAI